MLNILTLFGSAAAIGGGLRARGPDNEALRKREKQLLQIITAMDKELKDERELTSATVAKVEETKREVAQLQQLTSTLAQEKSALTELNQFMFLEKLVLCKSHQTVAAEADSLRLRNSTLRDQVETLKMTNEEQLLDHECHVDSLRAKVSEVVSRLLLRRISEDEALQEVEALGCNLDAANIDPTSRETLAIEEDAGPSTDSQTTYLDDYKERMQRLMSSSAAPRDADVLLPNRLTGLPFPQRAHPEPSLAQLAERSTSHDDLAAPLHNLPSATALSSWLPSFWRVSDGGSGGAGASDVRDKDQAPRSISSSSSGPTNDATKRVKGAGEQARPAGVVPNIAAAPAKKLASGGPGARELAVSQLKLALQTSQAGNIMLGGTGKAAALDAGAKGVVAVPRIPSQTASSCTKDAFENDGGSDLLDLPRGGRSTSVVLRD